MIQRKKAQWRTTNWAFRGRRVIYPAPALFPYRNNTLLRFRSGVKQACGIRESKLSALFELALPKPAAWGG
jgi:hypothetical protein